MGAKEFLLSGEFDVAGFMDIWDRATGGSGGGDMMSGIPNSAVFTGPSFEHQATDPSPLV